MWVILQLPAGITGSVEIIDQPSEELRRDTREASVKKTVANYSHQMIEKE